MYHPILFEFAIRLSEVAWPTRYTTVRNMERMQIVFGLTKAQKKLYDEALEKGWQSQENGLRAKHRRDGTIPHQVIDRARDHIHDIIN